MTIDDVIKEMMDSVLSMYSEKELEEKNPGNYNLVKEVISDCADYLSERHDYPTSWRRTILATGGTMKTDAITLCIQIVEVLHRLGSAVTDGELIEADRPFKTLSVDEDIELSGIYSIEASIQLEALKAKAERLRRLLGEATQLLSGPPCLYAATSGTDNDEVQVAMHMDGEKLLNYLIRARAEGVGE